MARLLNDASNEYLAVAQAVVSGEPFSFSAWVNSSDGADDQYVISIADKDVANQYHGIGLNSDVGVPDGAKAYTRDSSGIVEAKTSTDWVADTWHNVVGVWASSSSRAIYLDGGGKGTNSTSRSVSGLDRLCIGVSADSTPIDHLTGGICEVGVWDVALTDTEAAILGLGYSPLFVRPQSLVAYWRLIQDEDQDIVGGYDLTAYNTPSIADHCPKIIYPTPVMINRLEPAAPPAATVPIMMRYYRNLRV